MTTAQGTAAAGSRIKELFRKYGKVAVGVHFTVYFTFWAGCYFAIDNHLDVRGALERVGLLSGKSYDETANEAPEDRSWLDRTLSGGGSSIALAFLCNKALFPIRTPITITLTPLVARAIGRRAAAAAAAGAGKVPGPGPPR